jgi:hypothetical protein
MITLPEPTTERPKPEWKHPSILAAVLRVKDRWGGLRISIQRGTCAGQVAPVKEGMNHVRNDLQEEVIAMNRHQATRYVSPGGTLERRLTM